MIPCDELVFAIADFRGTRCLTMGGHESAMADVLTPREMGRILDCLLPCSGSRALCDMLRHSWEGDRDRNDWIALALHADLVSKRRDESV
jgi:hypothetical protein